MDQQLFLSEKTNNPIKGQLSDPINPIYGVPQGSPLCPILIILYVSNTL